MCQENVSGDRGTDAASCSFDPRDAPCLRTATERRRRRSAWAPWRTTWRSCGRRWMRPRAGVARSRRLPEDFAHDLNPKLGAEIAAQQRPTSLGLFVTPSGPAAWHALPSWYAVSAHDRAIDPALQRFMAQRAGSTTVEFAAASHVGGLTHYRARFVKLIEQAAQATGT